MLASQISQMLHGKRLGHGKYLARCPAHDDKTPSLSIRAGRKCVLLKCWPGCTPEEIVRAMGLKMRDLWYEQESMSPEIIQRLRDEDHLEVLDRVHGLLILVMAIDPQCYWGSIQREVEEERRALIFKLFPKRRAAYDLQIRIRRIGWDRMWEEFWQENPRLEKQNPIVVPLQTTLF